MYQAKCMVLMLMCTKIQQNPINFEKNVSNVKKCKNGFEKSVTKNA